MSAKMVLFNNLSLEQVENSILDLNLSVSDLMDKLEDVATLEEFDKINEKLIFELETWRGGILCKLLMKGVNL